MLENLKILLRLLGRHFHILDKRLWTFGSFLIVREYMYIFLVGVGNV